MNIAKGICQIFRILQDFLLEIIAPQDAYIRSIENMSPSDFAALARRPEAESQIEGITPLFSYKDKLIKTAILEVKTFGNKKIAALLGEILFESIIIELADLETFSNFISPLLVPIPVTQKSRRKRGFNQCELICEGLRIADKSMSIEVNYSLLKKIKETGDQVGKSRSERFENLKNCFGVHKQELVSGRNVIVFDDIVTTGATLMEAKKALKRAGAKKVHLVAFAH